MSEAQVFSRSVQDGVDRVRATLVLVLMDLKTARATRIPEPMRARIAQFQAQD